MPETTARRIAELLISDHQHDDSFDVDFLDPKFTELLIDALTALGCNVERIGANTRIRVNCKKGESQTA